MIANDSPPPTARPPEVFGLKSFILFFAGLVALFYWRNLAGIESFFYRDFGSFGYPLAHYHRECFWRGEIPLWNPLNYSGMPFLAQWNTLVCYPLSLVYLILPLPWSLNLFVLLHLGLAGVGMFLLAREWTGHGYAAAFAGAAYGFNGLLLNSLMWPNNIAALGWMPWVVLTVTRAYSGGAWRWWPAVVAGALQMLAGAPEIILLTWLIIGALWLARGAGRGGAGWRNWLAMTRRLALVILFIAGLSAIQLLPFLNLLAGSHRHANFDAHAWAMPWWGWGNLVLPLLQCHSTTRGVFFQPDQYWTASFYLGVATAALALTALFVRPRPRWLLVLALGALFGLLMALGPAGGFYTLVQKAFPPLSIMRFPVKFVVLAVFALPLLAAWGLAALFPSAGPDKASTRRSFWGSAAALLAILLLLLGWGYWWPIFPESRNPGLRDGLLRLVLLLAAAGLCRLAWSAANDGRRRYFQWAFLLAASADLLFHGVTLNPTVPSAALAPGLLTKEQLEPFPAHGRGRVFLTRETHDLLNLHSLANATQDVLGRRLGTIGNYNLLDGVASVGGFYSLYLPHQYALWEGLFFAPTNQFPARLADTAGVTHVPDPRQALAWKRLPSALPFISAGQEPVMAATDQEPAPVLAQMNDSRFDPRRQVLLPPAVFRRLPPVKASPAEISEARVAAWKLDFQVRAGERSLVVIGQSYHPHWRAWVDDQPVPVWRANHAYQALLVPAGTHRVRLAYEDRWFRLGALISGLTLAGLGLAVWRDGRGLARPPTSGE